MKIFKILPLFFVLFLARSILTGQEFHGGITTGLVGSQVAGDTYSGFGKAGLFLGGYVGWEFTQHSGLQMELTYFQKGSRENPTEDNDYDYYLFRANYLELPLLYQYKIKNFIVEAGPSLGFMVGYFEANEVEVISDKQGYNKPASVTFQMNIGMRYFISPKFGVDFRYNFSLWGIRTNQATGDIWRFWTYGQFNDALVLSVFYQFR